MEKKKIALINWELLGKIANEIQKILLDYNLNAQEMEFLLDGMVKELRQFNTMRLNSKIKELRQFSMMQLNYNKLDKKETKSKVPSWVG